MKSLYGSIDKINTGDKNTWPVSDDTVMFLATGEGLINARNETNFHKRMVEIAKAYELSMGDMGGRAPGLKCMSSLSLLKGKLEKFTLLPYDPRGGGCGRFSFLLLLTI
ncbi:hypothetical protein ABK040_007842 [Willaertia magna]